MNKKLSLFLVVCIVTALFIMPFTTVYAADTKPVISIEKTAWAENETICITWTPCEDVSYYMLTYYDETMQSGFPFAFTHNTSWEFNLSEGNYYLEVTALWDDEGIVSDSKSSDRVYIKVTDEKPVITMEKTKWMETETVTMSWVACTDVSYYMITYYDEDMQSGFPFAFTDDTTYDLELPVGKYYIKVSAYWADENGDTIDYKVSDSFFVEITKEAPVVSVEKTIWTENELIYFTWQQCSNADAYEINIYDKNMTPVAGGWTEDTNHTVHLSKGTYYIQVSGLVTNEYGETLEQSDSEIISITVEKPTSPALYVEHYYFGNTECVDATVYSVDECDIIMALYKDSKLVDVQSISYVQAERTPTFFYPTVEFDYGKIMLWESMSSMQELCKSEKFE